MFCFRKKEPLGKASYNVPCVEGVPNDYHLDAGAPFWTMQPKRPCPQPYTGDTFVLPVNPGSPVKTRSIDNGYYGITVLPSMNPIG